MSNEIQVEITFDALPDLQGELLKATQKAFAQVGGELTARFDDAISGAYWPWPDKTPRWGSGGGKTLDEAADNWNTWLYGSGTGKKPKAVAGSPRSIVDSGDLKQSRDFEINVANFTAQWNWGVD